MSLAEQNASRKQEAPGPNERREAQQRILENLAMVEGTIAGSFDEADPARNALKRLLGEVFEDLATLGTLRDDSAPESGRVASSAPKKTAHAYFTPEALDAICNLLDPFEGGHGKGHWLVGNALEIMSDELLLLCAGITNDSECRDFAMIENALRSIEMRVKTLSKVAKQLADGAA